MLYVLLGVSTIMAAAWVALLMTAAQEDWAAAAYVKVFDNQTLIRKLQAKDAERLKKLSSYRGFSAAIMKAVLGSGPLKEIARLERENERLLRGNLQKVSIFAIPGYVLMRKFDAIGRGGLHKTIYVKSSELYGRKHAANKAKHLLARMLSYPVIGVSASLSLGALVAAAGNTTFGMALIGGGSMLVLVLVYAAYDDLSDQANKRREDIARQFPNVVSKLALLVTSGMIMDRAWNETACSGGQTLYLEMRQTSEELKNLVSPEAAYGDFINRCNTKETAKLASAIMQNLSKGNAAIGILLKDMAKEAWTERRHTAKRDSEKANSKLMIPSMLLFLMILVMIMVPVAMNFSSL